MPQGQPTLARKLAFSIIKKANPNTPDAEINAHLDEQPEFKVKVEQSAVRGAPGAAATGKASASGMTAEQIANFKAMGVPNMTGIEYGLDATLAHFPSLIADYTKGMLNPNKTVKEYKAETLTKYGSLPQTTRVVADIAGALTPLGRVLSLGKVLPAFGVRATRNATARGFGTFGQQAKPYLNRALDRSLEGIFTGGLSSFNLAAGTGGDVAMPTLKGAIGGGVVAPLLGPVISGLTRNVGKWTGLGASDGMDVARRRAIEALEQAEAATPSMSPETPVPFGAERIAQERVGKEVQGLLQGGVQTIGGYATGGRALTARGAKEAQSMKDVGLYATGVDAEGAARIATEVGESSRGLIRRNKENKAVFDADEKAARIAAEQSKVTASDENIRVYGQAEAERMAAHKASESARLAKYNQQLARNTKQREYEADVTRWNAAERAGKAEARVATDTRNQTIVDNTNAFNTQNRADRAEYAEQVKAATDKITAKRVMDVLGRLDDGRPVPDPYDWLKEATDAMNNRADTNYPKIRQETGGKPFYPKEFFPSLGQSAVLRDAWAAAQRHRKDVIAAWRPGGDKPTPPPAALPQEMVNGVMTTVPDAEAMQVFQTYMTQVAGDNPNAAIIMASEVGKSGAKAQGEWIAAAQHPKFAAEDLAMKDAAISIADYESAISPFNLIVAPGNVLTTSAAARTARLAKLASMSLEQKKAYQDGMRAHIKQKVLANKFPLETGVKLLELENSQLSQEITQAFGPEGRREMIRLLAQPDKPGPFVPPPKPLVPPSIPARVSAPRPVSQGTDVLEPFVPQAYDPKAAPTPYLPATKVDPLVIEEESRNQFLRTLGLDIFNTPSVPTSLAPAKSLEMMRRDMSRMSPEERIIVQQGGGAALEGMRKKGLNLDPGTDEWNEQLFLASKGAPEAQVYRDAAGSWTTAKALENLLLGSKGPTTPINAGTFMDRAVRTVTPSATWTASRVAQALSQSGADADTDSMASELVRIVLDKPGSIERSIAELNMIRGARAAVASRAANMLARIVADERILKNPPESVVPYNRAAYPDRPIAPADSVADTASVLPLAKDTAMAALSALPLRPVVPTDTAPVLPNTVRKAPSVYNTIQRPPVQRDSTPTLDPRNLPALISSLPGMGASNRPVVTGAQGARQLPSMPEARSSTDPRKPIVVTSPGPSIIDRVKDAVGMSSPSSVSPKTPTSARLPGGLVQYARSKDVPTSFYNEAMEIVRREEGFVPYVYDDKAKKGTDRRLYMINGRWRQKDGKKPEGTPTIGHGLTDKDIVNRGTITEKESEVAARAHMARDVAYMIRKGSPISPILVSESYNMGVGMMGYKNIFKLLTKGQYEEAADSLATVTTSKGSEDPGLKARRLRAREQFLKKSP